MIVPSDRIIRHGSHLIEFDRSVCSHAHLEAIGKRSYERSEVSAVSSAIRSGDRVLEGGSGIGIISTTLAEIVGSENLVCCEANPHTSGLARRTIALNGYHCLFYEGLLDARPPQSAAHRPFLLAKDFLASSTYEVGDRQSAVTVPVFHFDSLLDQHKIDAIVLDIEGGECALLGSCSLSNIRKIVVEVHPELVGIDTTMVMIDRLEAEDLQLRWDLMDESVFVFDRPGDVETPAPFPADQRREMLELRLKAGAASLQSSQDERFVCVTKLVQECPGNRNFRNELASLLLLRRDWQTALAVLSEVMHDGDPFTLHLRAQCHLGLTQIDAASECWDKARRISPDRSLTHAMLAHCALRQGRPDRAMEAIQDAVALCPHVSWYWSLFERVAEAHGRRSLAQSARTAFEHFSSKFG